MKTREEYVSELKAQLDKWNVDMARWEERARDSKAKVEQGYEAQLAALRAQREKAAYQMRLLEGASATAWSEFVKGADEAWDSMREAIAKARTNFEKQGK